MDCHSERAMQGGGAGRQEKHERGDQAGNRIQRAAAEYAGAWALAAAALTGAGAWAVAPRLPHERRGHGVASISDVPYAHRGLHDAGSGLSAPSAAAVAYTALARRMAGRAGFGSDSRAGSGPGVGHEARAVPLAPENSLAAFAAACEAGYGIELDIQLTRNGQVVVHDEDMRRVSGDPRMVRNLTYAELCGIPLFDSAQHVPLFSDVLALVAGRVPLIVEYKMGERYDGDLMVHGDALLRSYRGPYVIESFHPQAVAWYRGHRPEVCRGQLAEMPELGDWNPRAAVLRSAGLLLFDWLGRPDFIAYDWRGGSRLPVRFARRLGAATVSWTVRGEAEQMASTPYFDRMIFESFIPGDSQPGGSADSR